MEQIKDLTGDPKKLVTLMFEFLPFLSPVVSVTIGIPEEEIKEWEFDKFLRFALVVLIQNASKLKQFMVLLNSTLKEQSFQNFN